MTKLAQKIHKGYHRTRKRKFDCSKKEFVEETPPGSKRKSKRREKLDLKDKLAIAQKVVIGLETQAGVARNYQVSQARVSAIVR
jgi:hypothetical protein